MVNMYQANIIILNTEFNHDNFVEKCIPAEFVTDYWAIYLARDCPWSSPHQESTWKEWCISSSSYHLNYQSMFPASTDVYSSSYEELSSGLKSLSIQQWPDCMNDVDTQNESKCWIFPKTRPPPISLPGWKPQPYCRLNYEPIAYFVHEDMEQIFPWRMDSIPFNIIRIPVVVVQSAPNTALVQTDAVSPCCLPPTPINPPSTVARFQNVSNFTRHLLTIHESEHGTYYVPPQTFKGDPFGGLERFWMNAFVWLFLDLFENRHLWTLRPVDRPPQDDPAGLPWISVIHSAKVRFNCDAANHGWTSMQGRVIFWYRILHGTDSNGYVRGEVVFKLYGQKCDRCDSNAFETALWYPEEITNALWRLYSKINERIYGRTVISPIRGSRGGKPLRPHKPELCQACNDGVCRIAASS